MSIKFICVDCNGQYTCHDGGAWYLTPTSFKLTSLVSYKQWYYSTHRTTHCSSMYVHIHVHTIRRSCIILYDTTTRIVCSHAHTNAGVFSGP
jgi:hypothetical protein